jgi:uncharacterized protein YciI
MFIISLKYKKPLAEVDAHLPAHGEYVKSQYAAGNFLLSGRKIPRTGGIILSSVKTREALQAIIEQDPFYRHQIADYDVVEFSPTMAGAGLELLIDK